MRIMFPQPGIHESKIIDDKTGQQQKSSIPPLISKVSARMFKVIVTGRSTMQNI